MKTFSFYWENDSVTGSDQDYSNGLKLTWSRPYRLDTAEHSAITDWVFSHLPLMHDEKSLRATAFSLGQYIYTPKDTERSDLIVEDRPYAGYSFMGFGFLSQTTARRDVWELDIGILGPWSLGETTQNGFHDLIRTNRARGWDHQLGNEPGLELIYETKWRLLHAAYGQSWGVDLIPHLGAQLGNIATAANVGVELRFGWSIPQDFETCPIRPGCDAGNALDNTADTTASATRIGFYLFTAVEGRAVLRDIFLDGNTWQKSHKVDKQAAWPSPAAAASSAMCEFETRLSSNKEKMTTPLERSISVLPINSPSRTGSVPNRGRVASLFHIAWSGPL